MTLSHGEKLTLVSTKTSLIASFGGTAIGLAVAGVINNALAVYRVTGDSRFLHYLGLWMREALPWVFTFVCIAVIPIGLLTFVVHRLAGRAALNTRLPDVVATAIVWTLVALVWEASQLGPNDQLASAGVISRTTMAAVAGSIAGFIAAHFGRRAS